MKTYRIIPAVLLFILAACQEKKGDVKGSQSTMLMDSLYQSDKTSTVVRKGDKIRLVEEMKNFEDNPNIMQADLEAMKQTPSKEIQYLKKGEKVVLGEKGPDAAQR